jgi:hypothetical protein
LSIVRAKRSGGPSPTRLGNDAGTEETHAQYLYSVMKLPVIGGFTNAEGVALGAYATSGPSGSVTPIPDLNTAVHGILLDNGTFPFSFLGGRFFVCDCVALLVNRGPFQPKKDHETGSRMRSKA